MIDLRLGDCLEVMRDLDAGSVDAAVTDPPYEKKYIHLWAPMAMQLYRVLRDGGEVVTLLGHYQVPEVIEAFTSAGFRYWWICGMRQHARRRMIGKRVNIYFKPALWFVKGKKRKLHDMPSDLVLGSMPQKDQHPWEQGTTWFDHWCDRITNPGEIIIDPFMGTGTTGVSCITTGRNFIGIEKDPSYFALAEKRIETAAATLRQLELVP